MTGDTTATVIIVNFNGAHLLPGCLNALARQGDDQLAFDTIVVDNASSDDLETSSLATFRGYA